MTTRAVRSSLGLALAVLCIVVSAAAGAFAAPSPAAEERFVALIAEERSKATLPQYAVAGDLVEVARQHAEDMARDGRIYHNPNLQSDTQNWQSLGENVGKGSTADGIHAAFMDSKSHRDLIVSTRFTQVGVGVVEREGTLYVSQVFRRPSAPPPPPSSTQPQATTTTSARPSRTTSVPAPAPASGRAGSTQTPAEPTTSTTAQETTTTEATPEPSVPADGVGPERDDVDDETAASPPRRMRGDGPAREVTLPIGVAASLLVAVVGGLTGQVSVESSRRRS